MKRRLHILLFWCLVLLLPGLTLTQAMEDDLGIISTPLANVHKGSLPRTGISTQVLMGDLVRILEKRDNRYRIVIPNQDNREGWIQQEAVLIPRDKGRSWLDEGRDWIVIARSKTKALILDKTGDHKVSLYAGTRLPVLQKTAQGRKVQFPDRSTAILPASDVIPEKSADPFLNETKPEDIAGTARQFANVISIAGGLSAQGMDMEGLIYITYRIHGISLSPDLSSFKNNSMRTARQDLEPGDILVFGGGGLGLYLGAGQFVGAQKKAGLKIASLHDRRTAKSFQYGLRILGAGEREKKNVAAMTADEIGRVQTRVSALSLGKRIAYWAVRFIGTPYDTDPLGLYVRTSRIIADEKADCMYHTFRSVELAQTSTPEEAVNRALDLRFRTQGKLKDGLVVNYEDRYDYGEDMVTSGKWGKNITADLGQTERIAGSRGKETVDILPKSILATPAFQKQLKDGDIIYWVKDPKKRVVEEIVAHISIIRVKSGTPYLVHASGDKDRKDRPGGGVVKELPFAEYVANMRFIGAFVTRFEE